MTFHVSIARFCSAVLLLLCLGITSQGAAQAAREEALDVTRLDVERLPPEAIQIDRDMYSHGVFVEGNIGGRGVMGGAGRLFHPGLLASVGAGYEVASWFLVGAAIEMSLHPTNAPAPPTATTLQFFGGLVEARLQANLSSRVALWLGGQVGLLSVSGNFLSTYGVQDADAVGAMFGGQLGFDWHFKSRHHSIGIASGARLYPSLVGFDGEQAIGIHATTYLRHVF